MASLMNFLSNIEGRSNTNLFQRIGWKRETLHNWFYKTSISSIPKQGKFITQNENYKLISSLNIDTKFLSKILALNPTKLNPTKQKNDSTSVGFMTGMQDCFNVF